VQGWLSVEQDYITINQVPLNYISVLDLEDEGEGERGD